MNLMLVPVGMIWNGGSISRTFSFRTFTHQIIIILTIVTAVNSEIRMPRPMVMAKPRIGPVPTANSRTTANSVVILESMMVANAFLKPYSSDA